MLDDDDKDSADYGLPEGKSTEDFLAEMRTRAEWACDASDSMFKLWREDIRFCDIPGHQWDEYTQQERLGRPCYEFNKVRKNIQQITNEQRQNRPRIKIRAVKNATEDLAEIRMGLIRNIEAISNAEHAYDTAFDFAVKGGYGAWRVKTQYCDDDAFDQEIRIEEFEDPSAVRFDPTAYKFDRRDARYCFVFDRLPRSEFKQRWPKAKLVDFTAGTRQEDTRLSDWYGEQEIRIAEYWYKVPVEIKLYLMTDGSTVDADEVEEYLPMLAEQGIMVVHERTVPTYDVYSCVVSGVDILEKPTKWAGRNIPIVPVWGNLTRIEGKDFFCGEVRFQRDPQKLYNYERSTLVEVVAKQPKQPLLASAKAVEGFEDDYQAMGHSDRPVLLYNPDPTLPGGGMPQRAQPAAFPVALAQSAQMSNDDLKSTSGIYDASVGAKGNETSGIAINSRKVQGAVANFQYIDNLSKAMRYTGEILNELIPQIYDTERQIRIIGVDGTDKVVAVNHAIQDPGTGQWDTINDLSQGKFDVAVDVGPSFTTQRMETAEAMSQMAQVPGPFQPLVQYGYLRVLDVPGIEDIQEAARLMLVKQGILPPEEGDPQPPPPQPNPKDIADAQLKQAQAAKAGAEAGKTQVETQQLTQMGPLEIAHTAALTAKEAAHAAAKIPPLLPDPSIPQAAPPAPTYSNPTLGLTPPGQL